MTMDNEYYTIHGQLTDADDKNVYAKKIYLEKSRQYYYYIAEYRHRLYNPYDKVKLVKNHSITMLKVSKNKYDYYLNFLKTGQHNYLLRAEREQ